MQCARQLLPLAMMALLLAGCALEWRREYPLQCRSGEQVALRDALYFGRSIAAGGHVGDADWEHFRDTVLSAEFPRGFSELDARGHWRGADGQLIAEDTRLVLIVHEDNAAGEQALTRVVSAYRTKFRQESVLRERSVVCTRF